MTISSRLGTNFQDDSSHDVEVVATGALGADYTPLDTAGNVVTCRGLSFGTAGAIQLVTAAGATITIPTGLLTTGIIHPIKFIKIVAAGTTAQGIVAYS